jgi:nucleotide-binding universal stress UspA family protein
MTSNPQPEAETPDGPGQSLFDRVLVGVDGSEHGYEACRQAAYLAEPGSPIDVIAVVHVSEAARDIYSAPHIVDELQRGADEALERAVRLIGDCARPRCVDGFVATALIDEAERGHATLIAVGTDEHRRMTEILVGGVAGELLHTAPCSVLIARRLRDSGRFPRSIVVGVDGSACSEDALGGAEHLAERLGVPLRVITAARGKNVDLDRVRRRCPAAEVVDARPVEALASASHAADLVVVGSRGSSGVRALGSVSERVAHQAQCSVVVARTRRRV